MGEVTLSEKSHSDMEHWITTRDEDESKLGWVKVPIRWLKQFVSEAGDAILLGRSKGC